MLKWGLGGWFVKGNPIQLRAQEATETRVQSRSRAVVFQRRVADKVQVEAMNASLSAAHCFRLGDPKDTLFWAGQEASAKQVFFPDFPQGSRWHKPSCLHCHLHLMPFLPVAAGVRNKGCSKQPWGICVLTTAPCFPHCYSSGSEDKLVYHPYEFAFKNHKSKRDRREGFLLDIWTLVTFNIILTIISEASILFVVEAETFISSLDSRA